MVSDILIKMSISEIQNGLMKEVMTPERTLEYVLRLEQTQKSTKTIRDNGGYGILLSGYVNFVLVVEGIHATQTGGQCSIARFALAIE